MESETVRRKKRIIGLVAIILLLVFTAMAILGYLPVLVWLIADLIVAAIANMLFKRVSRTPL